MKFKKIYIEIINHCNLNCSFCVKTTKSSREMTISEFTKVLESIHPYTDYIYLHVQGEPLLHPNIKEFLDLAEKMSIAVNITTNATLIKKSLPILLESKAIRQINVSLQALQKIINKYDIYNSIVELIQKREDIYLSLRMWGNFSDESIQKEISYFKTKLNSKSKDNKLKDHVFVSLDEEFKWPCLSDPINETISKCKVLHNQIAILCDGTVVPCCLDKDGVIELGNIYESNFSDIISSERYQNFIKGFNTNKLNEELCKRCTYRDKFK